MVSLDCSVEGEILEDSGDPPPLHQTQLYSYLFYILDFQIRFLLSKDHANRKQKQKSFKVLSSSKNMLQL